MSWKTDQLLCEMIGSVLGSSFDLHLLPGIRFGIRSWLKKPPRRGRAHGVHVARGRGRQPVERHEKIRRKARSYGKEEPLRKFR